MSLLRMVGQVSMDGATLVVLGAGVEVVLWTGATVVVFWKGGTTGAGVVLWTGATGVELP